MTHFKRLLLLGIILCAPSPGKAISTDNYSAKLEATPFSAAENLKPLIAQSQKKLEEENCTHHSHRVVRKRMKSGTTVFGTLHDMGISGEVIDKIVRTATPFQNMNHLPAKTSIVAHFDRTSGEPKLVEMQLSPSRMLVVRNIDQNLWNAKIRRAKTYSKLFTFSGKIKESFWVSGRDAGLSPQMIIELSNLFASLIDFNRETQQHDRWRLVVERVYANEVPLKWGRILAAEYESQGIVYTGVYFHKKGLSRKYYTPDGSSLARMFLKSPIEFGRVTSGFSRNRFHPILKVRRPHYGVDYGARTGTPVMSVGDGKVTFANWRGAGGKTIQVRHSGKYQTAYKHLSRFAKGIGPGSKVKMGQIIGYVGATGRATGPHLHFEFYENGSYVDPLGMRFPSVDPLPAAFREDFNKVTQQYLSMLPPWEEERLIASYVAKET